jgi:hypothetical protein
VLGDLDGSLLGTNDGIELGFMLGDLEVEGSVLGGDDNMFLRRRRAITVLLTVGTDVGNMFLLRRRATTVLVTVGTEVSDTGRGLGLLVGFLIGGHVGFLTGGHVGFFTGGGGHVGFSFSPEYGDIIFELFPCFPALPFFFCEVNAIELLPPMAFCVCVVSTSLETMFFSSFVFSFTNIFASLFPSVSAALFVSLLKRSIDFLTASTSASGLFSFVKSARGRLPLPRGMEGNLEEFSTWAAAMAKSSITWVILLSSVSFLITCVPSIAEKNMFWRFLFS